MYVAPLRWCPPTTSNMEFHSSSPQTNSSEVDASGIPEIHHDFPIHSFPPTNNNNFNSSSQQTNGSEFDSAKAKSCHQCRQKTWNTTASCKNPRNGKPCVIRFCHKCLLNRYGEEVNEVSLLTDWMCPKCRGICNCSLCMKKRGQRPTGLLAHKAKASGFKSVSEMLIKNASEDLAFKNVNNVNVVPSNKATLEKELVFDSSEKSGKENSLGGMTQSQGDGPEAWGANDFSFDPASLASNGFIINPTT